MVEVKVYLYDAIEIQMLAQLEAALATKREQEQPKTEEPKEPWREEPPETPEPQVNSAEYLAEQEKITEAIIADTAPLVDDVTLVRVFTEFAQRAGVPAAKELLKSFGATRVMDVKAEDRGRFVAELQPAVSA